MRLFSRTSKLTTELHGENGAAYFILCDDEGNPYTVDNPLSVDLTDATVTIVSDSLNVAEIETASDNTRIEISRYDVTINRNGDGTVNYLEITVLANTYRRTFAYTDGFLTSMSRWTLQ